VEIQASDAAFISLDKAGKLRKHEAVPGDLVIAALADPVGRCAQVPPEVQVAIVKADCIRLRVASQLNPLYVMHFLNSPLGRTGTQEVSHGVGRLRINLGEVRRLRIPVAPLPEQVRILAKIENLFLRRKKASEAIQSVGVLLKELRESILVAAFSGALTTAWRKKKRHVEPASALLKRIRAERRLRWEEAEMAKMRVKGKRPSDDRWKDRYEEPEAVDGSELSELPEGWAWAKWQEIGFCQNGRPFPSSEYANSGFKLLRPGNLASMGKLVWNSQNTKYLDHKWAFENSDFVIGANELVMNLTAQSLADEFLGRVCVTEVGESCLLNQRLARLLPVAISPQFCLWLFKSPLVRRYIDTLNKGTLIQHMFTSQVDNFLLPIPPISEQAEIIKRIEDQMMRIEDLERQVGGITAQLEHLDRSILSRAFRGELVPQDPNDEPASALLERIQAERALR
jgi:type I restriction enzyme, S subunit